MSTQAARPVSDPRTQLQEPGAVPREGLTQADMFPWFGLVEASGDEGRCWVRRYREPRWSSLRNDVQRALLLLRQQRVEEGRSLLDRTYDAIRPAASVSESLFQVLARGHATANAYAHYLRRDLDAATVELHRAQDHTEAAISRRPVLLPLAEMCPELHIQHLRIAKSRRDWRGMRQRVAALRSVMTDEIPLCRLADGTEIRFATLGEYSARVSSLPSEVRESLEAVLDVESRLLRFERIVRELYALSGFVIALSPP